MGEVRLSVDRLKEMARKHMKLSPDLCIYKFDKEYIPQRIGLGLFHHTDPSSNEQELRDLKNDALSVTVGQMRDMTKTKLINQVVRLLVCIEGCYVDSDKYSKIKDYGETERAEAFVKDACFILQFLTDGIPGLDIDKRNDMMVDIFTLQNQIPLFILCDIMKWKYEDSKIAAEQFAKILTKKRPFRFLSPLALSSGEDIIGFLEGALLAEGDDTSHHLLHLLHKSIAHFLRVPEQYTTAGLTNPLKCHNILGSLDTYNIKFKARNEQIFFKKKLLPSSTLYLPQISLDGDTFPVHRSLMQFGRISRNYKLICDLTCLMKCIAIEERNENLLRNKEIIQGARDGDRFFKRLDQLCTGVTEWHGGVYRTVIDQLDEHCKIIPHQCIYKVYKFLLRYGSFGLFLTILFGVLGIVVKK